MDTECFCDQASVRSYCSRLRAGSRPTCLQFRVRRRTGRSEHSQRADETPGPRRDVARRWWKLAASRARVVRCRSRGLGCTCPLYRADTLDKFKDVTVRLGAYNCRCMLRFRSVMSATQVIITSTMKLLLEPGHIRFPYFHIYPLKI